MWDMARCADEQIRRLNERIAEVAADYDRMRLRRTISLHAGNLRRARDLQRRLHMLNNRLAMLARQLKQSEHARELM